ncbi:MAG TPA: hypothetical protein DCS21_03625 [Gammaproteobacteria bacterium]|nr:hypothetical protein [Gammaproteobacteria bacterium]
MQRNTSRKIAKQHSQPQPGWVVSDGTASDWVEQVLKPLLADWITPPPQFEMPHEQRSGPTRANTVDPTQLIGSIHLSVKSETHRHERYDVYPYYDSSIIVPLYWVNPGDGSHQIAISPGCIAANGHYYGFSSKTSEMRYLAGPEALRALLDALLEQLRQDIFRVQKTRKVRNIQAQAVEAQIRQLANEQQFAFMVSTSPRLIRIEVRLDNSNQLTITVPFSEFERVLPQLRETVIHLRALHEQRIHFRTHQCSYGGGTWIEPEPQPDTDPVSS